MIETSNLKTTNRDRSKLKDKSDICYCVCVCDVFKALQITDQT